MKELAESLLSLIRLDSGHRGMEWGTCRLDLIAGDVIESLAPLAAEHGISLNSDFKPVSCPGNHGQLSQVIVNLVTNAIRYNSPGGMVIVSTSSQDRGILLTVRDTGRGIAEEDLPHLFERFYRADKARSSNVAGAGLGLAITKEIVQAHGGRIMVSSELGNGSLLTVCLPV
jgi:two-component system sensor histidine kinase ResE